MRFNVTFVIGTLVSLRQQWLIGLMYQQVAEALLPYGIQKARAIYFGQIVKEAQPLLLAKELPNPLPNMEDGNNLAMGLQLAHTLASDTPTLVVTLHHLFDVGNRIPSIVRQASSNTAHSFMVNNNAQGTHNQGLVVQLSKQQPSTAVFVPATHDTRAAFDLFLAQQADKWSTTT